MRAGLAETSYHRVGGSYSFDTVWNGSGAFPRVSRRYDLSSTEEVENFLAVAGTCGYPDAWIRCQAETPSGRGKWRRCGAIRELGAADLTRIPDRRLAEAYRQLRTSILLSTAGHAPKSLLITSSLPSEGKTTTATNTAISLAQTGRTCSDHRCRYAAAAASFGLQYEENAG